MGPSVFAFVFLASIDSIRFFGPAMAPRMPAARKRPSTALPAAKAKAKTRQETTAMVAELVTALKRSFNLKRNSTDAAAMTGYVSLGLLRRLIFAALEGLIFRSIELALQIRGFFPRNYPAFASSNLDAGKASSPSLASKPPCVGSWLAM